MSEPMVAAIRPARAAASAAIRHGRAIVLLATAIVALIPVMSGAAARAATGPYVALGDSYTAGPLIPTHTGTPGLCLRSTDNYPADLARAIHPSSFTDASCSGATTVDMTEPQSLLHGIQTAPPQFDALSADDALVTVGIGGNDSGLIGIAEKCAKLDVLDPYGTPCRNYFRSSGSDPNLAAIAATGPKVQAVLQGIHQLAPQAKVMLVGYPDGLPVNGTGCWPRVPLARGDILYFDSLELRLNAVLRLAARADDATYVDTFSSSIGHDACQPAGTAWVNSIIPTSLSAPLHPNEAGELNMADQILSDL